MLPVQCLPKNSFRIFSLTLTLPTSCLGAAADADPSPWLEAAFFSESRSRSMASFVKSATTAASATRSELPRRICRTSRANASSMEAFFLAWLRKMFCESSKSDRLSHRQSSSRTLESASCILTKSAPILSISVSNSVTAKTEAERKFAFGGKARIKQFHAVALQETRGHGRKQPNRLILSAAFLAHLVQYPCRPRSEQPHASKLLDPTRRLQLLHIRRHPQRVLKILVV